MERGYEMNFYVKDGIAILEWKEDITFQNVDAFRERITALQEQSAQLLILNMEQVTYVNSAALGILADAVVKGRRNGKEMLIAGIQPSVGEIFSIVKFEKFIKLYSELEPALAYGRSVLESK
jgi:anti-sigma B factor antagonist